MKTRLYSDNSINPSVPTYLIICFSEVCPVSRNGANTTVSICLNSHERYCSIEDLHISLTTSPVADFSCRQLMNMPSFLFAGDSGMSSSTVTV